MVTGLFFLSSIVAVLLLIFWFIREEKKPPEEQGFSGLFAMKAPGDLDASSSRDATKKSGRDNWPAADDID